MVQLSHTGIARLCGLLASILGLELAIGWLLHNESMVRIVAASNSVSFNTAMAFILAGSAFALGGEARWRTFRRAAAWILIVGALVIFAENFFDVALGLDWESLHRTVADGSPRPGRVAPNTCLCLLLLGVLLHLYDRPATRVLLPVVNAVRIALVVLIATGVIGLLLDPTLMFGWYKFNRMAAPTALGLSLLWVASNVGDRTKLPVAPRTPREHERSILLTGAALLLGMGTTIALTSLVMFANSQQESIRSKLQAEMLGQGRLAAVVIGQASTETSTLLKRPLLSSLIARVGSSHTPEDTAQLRTTLAGLMQTGFSSFTAKWNDGTPEISVGSSAAPLELALDLKQPANDKLVWAGRKFYYQAHVTLTDTAGRAVGVLTTERPLDALNNIYQPVTHEAASAEVVLCGAWRHAVGCFPSKLHPSIMLLAPLGQRSRLPVDDALTGATAIRTAKDYRGENVVVAYAQVGDTGLALLSKVDTVEIYAPINSLIYRSLVVLILTLVIGIVFLRKTLGPLLAAIVASENTAVLTARRMQSVTDNLPVLIGFVDAAGIYRFANATYEKWFGISAAAVIGRHPRDLLDGPAFDKAWPYMQRALAGETVKFSTQSASPLPNYPKHVSVTYIPDRGDDGKVLGFNVLAFDETERLDQERALAHIAHHDSLTELPNRRLFEDRLQQSLLRGRRSEALSALFYLDIDYFKKINDTCGHASGDELLKEFAQRLRCAVRSSDTVARLGGDEFVILMEDLSCEEDVEAVAAKILQAMRVPFDIGGRPLAVTTSIGISFCKGASMTAHQYLQKSDEALYNAKAAGRNRSAVLQAGRVLARAT